MSTIRRVILACAVFVTATSVVATTNANAYGSATSLATSNSWILTDLAGGATISGSAAATGSTATSAAAVVSGSTASGATLTSGGVSAAGSAFLTTVGGVASWALGIAGVDLPGGTDETVTDGGATRTMQISGTRVWGGSGSCAGTSLPYSGTVTFPSTIPVNGSVSVTFKVKADGPVCLSNGQTAQFVFNTSNELFARWTCNNGSTYQEYTTLHSYLLFDRYDPYTPKTTNITLTRTGLCGGGASGVAEFGWCHSLDGTGSGSCTSSTGIYQPLFDYNNPTPSNTNPLRHVEQTVTCKDTATGEITTESSASTPNYWAGVPTVAMVGLQCPSSSVLISHAAIIKTDGAPDVDLGVRKQPEEFHNIPSGCLATGVECKLDVQKTNDVTNEWDSCSTAATGAATATVGITCTPEEVAQPDGTKMRCRFGTAGDWIKLPLDRCKSLLQDPTATPDTPTRTATPTTPTATTPTPTPTPTDGSCDLGWADVLTGTVMFKATKCALQWAFVPDPVAVQASFQGVTDTYNVTAIGVVQNAVSDVISPVTSWTSDASCLGPTINIPPAGFNNAHPFHSCDGLSKTMRDWMFPILTMVLYIGGGITGLNMVTRTFGAQTMLKDGGGQG